MGETIGDYLIRRLQEAGAGHVFGVPGDYVLTFFKQLEQSPLKTIDTSDEQGAGFAADAYARLKGIGVVCITYSVGGLKVTNPVAQAYAEFSPLVVISGAPGVEERKRNTLVHHKIRAFDTQQKIFEQLTVGTAVLNDPTTAAAEIDRVLALAKRHSRPVYIELPRDMVTAEIIPSRPYALPDDTSDPDVLAHAIGDAVERIAAARRPVVLAGVELHRFKLQPQLADFVHRSGIPVAATITGKSVFPESDPAYIGLYEGAMGRETVRAYVENSDCIIMLGAMLTDTNLGIYTANLDRAFSIYAARDRIAIGFRSYEGIRMEDFVAGLAAHDWQKRTIVDYERPEHPGPFQPGNGAMTVAALFHQVNAFLAADIAVIADPGDALFGATDLYIHDDAHFMAPAYYCSLGFSVPAAIGVAMAHPEVRPLVLVGDGAFQMTGMELGTAIRYGVKPIVVLLDNDGYGTERPMLDGAYNDVYRWNYAKVPEVFGAGLGIKVETEAQFDEALVAAKANTESFTLIQVMLDRNDHSPALTRLTDSLKKRVAKAG